MSKIAVFPLDLGMVADFLFYLVDGRLTLVFFAVDHDNMGFVVHEGTRDLKATGKDLISRARECSQNAEGPRRPNMDEGDVETMNDSPKDAFLRNCTKFLIQISGKR